MCYQTPAASRQNQSVRVAGEGRVPSAEPRVPAQGTSPAVGAWWPLVFPAEVELCAGLQSRGACVQMFTASSQVPCASPASRAGAENACLREKWLSGMDRSGKQYTAYHTALPKALCCCLPSHQKSLGRGCTCRADSVPPAHSEPLSPTHCHLPLLSAIAWLHSAGLGVSVSPMRTGVSLHPWQPLGLSCHFAVPPGFALPFPASR